MQNNTTIQLWSDLSESQSEAINGGFFGMTGPVRKKNVVIVNQESGSALFNVFTLGPVNLNSGNISVVTATIA